MKCPKCGKDIAVGERFCVKCGQPIYQQPQAPRPVQPQVPRPVQPQAPRLNQSQGIVAEQEIANKGFFNRVGSGIASAMSGRSFSQGYDRRREVEHTNEMLIGGAKLKLQEFRKAVADIKRKYPQIINDVDEKEIEQLVEAAQEAIINNLGNVVQRNGRIRKALAALDEKIQEFKNRVDSAAESVGSATSSARRRATTVELQDINQEELSIVEHKAIWGIQRGQIARRITERELDAVDGLNGVIVQQGCSVVVFIDGEFVKIIDSGAYSLSVKSDSELAKMIDALTNQLMDEYKSKKQKEEEEERTRINNQSIAERGGLVGIAGGWIKRGLQFAFGAQSENKHKKNDKNKDIETLRKFKDRATRMVKDNNKQPLLSIILISNRHINLIFGGDVEDDGVAFKPYVVPMKFLDVNVGVEIESQVTDALELAANYLTEKNSLATNDVFKMLNVAIENVVRQELHNVEYTMDGLGEDIKNRVAQRIKESINRRIYGLECVQILNVIDSQEDVFGRFRQVEKEIYCSEKELDYMVRTSEIRNRMEQAQNRSLLNSAHNKADYNQAMLEIDKQGMLTEDERAEFVQMLETQRQVREAKTKEEAYGKLLSLEGNRLVHEDELEAIKDAIEHDRINRAEITEIMRIQSNRKVENERLQAEWALDDSKQDHDWAREDLARKRSWGIEDEEYERNWLRDEREYDRQHNRMKAEDDYDFEKMMRMRNVALEDQLRIREEKQEDEDRDYERQRQRMLDVDRIADNQSQRQMQNLEAAMKLQMMQEAQEQQHIQNLAAIESEEQKNRYNNFANMSAEQIRAAQLSNLSEAAQVSAMNAYNSEKENEMLKQQMLKEEECNRLARESSAKDKEDLMNFAMQMAGMVKDTAASVSAVHASSQHDQIERLRSDKLRVEQQQQHAQDQALNAMSGVATAAASNLYTEKTDTKVSVDQNAPSQNANPARFECECYNCGHRVLVYQGMPKCPDCGAPFQW